MNLTSYPAGKGDSFLLSWGPDPNLNYLLIDSGIGTTYRYIKEDLKNKRLKAVILTHVDYDHLGGFFKFLNDNTRPGGDGFSVFLNTPELISTPTGDDKVALEHGIDLEKLLKDIPITPEPLYNGFTENNILELEGMAIQVLTPSKTVLQELLSKWTAHELYKKYQEESKTSDKVGKPTETLIDYISVINGKETVEDWEDDLINASSISFISSYNGCSILFLGDANPDLVYNALVRLGYSPANRLQIEFTKVSHHGCKHNSNQKLYSILRCNNFIISTNGAGPYYHPDRETIIRLSEYAREDKSKILNLYLNYQLDKSNFITPAEECEWKLNIEHRNNFNLEDCECFQKR